MYLSANVTIGNLVEYRIDTRIQVTGDYATVIYTRFDFGITFNQMTF